MNIKNETLLRVFEDTKIIMPHPIRPPDFTNPFGWIGVYCQPDVIEAMQKA